MKIKKNLGFILLFIVFIVISFPILLLLLWSIVARWPWPELIPQALTNRAIIDVLQYQGQIGKVILTNGLLSFGVALLCIIISVMTSRFIYACPPTWQRHLQQVLQLPFVVPATIFAMGIHLPFIQMGLADTIWGVVIVHLIYSMPYAFLLIHPTYQALGENLEEQALLLGANRRQAFIKVTLPLLLPVFFPALAMAFIVSYSQYFLTLVIGGGSIQTYMTLIFPYFQNKDRTIAAVYSLIFLIQTLIFFAAAHKLSESLQAKYQTFTYYDQ